MRLEACLLSARGKVALLVYVDSGSTDSSLELARSIGCDTVELDLSTPFTAARARNEGFARLLQLVPDIEFVQFVDGDCEVVDGWHGARILPLIRGESMAQLTIYLDEETEEQKRCPQCRHKSRASRAP